MRKFGIQWRTGVRWLNCGWRLFRRNPWLLIPMGSLAVIIISLSAAIPLLGPLLVAALAPILLCGTYLAIDEITHLKRPLPPALRPDAIKRAPTELIAVFRDGRHLMPMSLVSIYSISFALVTSVVVLAIAGGAWGSPLESLSMAGMFKVLSALLFACLAYFLLAGSIAYALPLAFLADDDPIPAITQSFMTTVRNAGALLPVAILVVLPFLSGALASYLSPAGAYLIRLLLGAITLPIASCSLYCSYRTLFTVREGAVARAM